MVFVSVWLATVTGVPASVVTPVLGRQSPAGGGGEDLGEGRGG